MTVVAYRTTIIVIPAKACPGMFQAWAGIQMKSETVSVSFLDSGFRRSDELAWERA